MCIRDRKKSVLFGEADELASKQDVQITLSRTARRGCFKTDPTPKEVEDYFRRTIHIPMLDNVIVDVKARLPPEVLGGYTLHCILPTAVPRGDVSPSKIFLTVETLSKNYAKVLDKTEAEMKIVLGAEFRLWSATWNRMKSSGEKIPSLDFRSKELNPTVRELLIILAILLSSIATQERDRFPRYVARKPG